jgi:hypothetical protein
MTDSHLIIDIGPGVLTALGLLFTFLTSSFAAYYAYSTKQAVNAGNSELAARLARIADAKAATLALANEPVAPIAKG